jgi:hypothetical protein
MSMQLLILTLSLAAIRGRFCGGLGLIVVLARLVNMITNDLSLCEF